MNSPIRPYEPLTSDNAAVVLVDHQLGLLTGVRDYPIGVLKHNVVALAQAATVLKLPIVVKSANPLSGVNEGLKLPCNPKNSNAIEVESENLKRIFARALVSSFKSSSAMCSCSRSRSSTSAGAPCDVAAT